MNDEAQRIVMTKALIFHEPIFFALYQQLSVFHDYTMYNDIKLTFF